MKAVNRLNLSFYKGHDLYSDGDIEDKILSLVQENDDYFEIIQSEISWPLLYHLSPLRRNLLEWYDFDKEAELLEIGAGCGALTSLFCEKVKSVTAVELSKRRAEIIAHRTKGKENIEIIVGNLNDIVFEKKFDYITLVGVFEYAGSFTECAEDEDTYEKFLCFVKSLLKPEGTLIIAIENAFGLKYFAGSKEDHTATYFDSIEGYSFNKAVKTFGKYELEELLTANGFTFLDFYYPMPDYKIPTQIFTDDFVPTYGQMNNFALSYDQEGLELFDIKAAYSHIISNKQFDFFANSFLIFASNIKSEARNLYVNFKRELAKKYQIQTSLVATQASEINQAKRYSLKKPLCYEASEHIEQIYSNAVFLKERLAEVENVDIVSCNKINDMIKFDFAQGSSLREEIDKAILKKSKEKVLLCFENYLQLLWRIYKPKVQDFDSAPIAEIFGQVNIPQTPCTEYANIDLIFDNIFRDNEKYTIIDYEWLINSPMPLNYILVRSICNINYIYGARLNSFISLEDIFNFCKIPLEEVSFYAQMEENFHVYIYNGAKYRINPNYRKAKTSLAELLYFKESFNQLDNVLTESLALQEALQELVK